MQVFTKLCKAMQAYAQWVFFDNLDACTFVPSFCCNDYFFLES
jgi:hypothetical protein